VTLPLNSTPKRICLGFGPHEGKCTNAAGPRSPYWCDRCEDLRREHITKQLENLMTARAPKAGR
jgi:hypothetical protein